MRKDDTSANISSMPRLSVFEKLYGHIGIIENFMLITQLLIIARQCIYVCRGTGKVPNFYHFKNMIAVTMALEKVNAIQQDKIDFYLKKWEPLTEVSFSVLVVIDLGFVCRWSPFLFVL